MPRQALGIIELRGLVPAIGAADAALKTADIKLIGYETANGRGGMVLLKFEGEVDAVNAAMDAARAAGASIGEVLGSKVIPRPADGSDQMVRSAATVGQEPSA